jgi:hypothetical protein
MAPSSTVTPSPIPLVTRRGAKACKELGIEQQSFQAYHKNHVNKVMAIAFTAFAFVDCIDNGGCA